MDADYSETDRALLEAVSDGDAAAVRRALDRGADPEVRFPRFTRPDTPFPHHWGVSALSKAVEAGRLDVVEALLEAGAAHHSRPYHDGGWPLSLAVHLSDRTLVRRLLAAGSALDAQGAPEPSLLCTAISTARYGPTPAALDVLKVLLEAGATASPTEEPPLVEAVNAPPAVMRCLLAHDEDPDQRRSDGTPVLVLAARRGNPAVVDHLLMAGADADLADAEGRTALMHAAERNDDAVVSVLLLAGCDQDRRTPDGTTAFRLAEGWQHQNIQHRMGARSTGLDDIDIPRTVVRMVPTGMQLRGSPATFSALADVLTHGVDAVGIDWAVLTGTEPEEALAFAARLREDPRRSERGSWHLLHASSAELATVRGALLEFAYGSATRRLPAGTTQIQLIDMLEDFLRQLER